MGRLRTGIGLLIILAGVGIYACPVIREWQFDRQVRTVIRDFEERYHAETDEADMIAGSAAFGETEADIGNADSGELSVDIGSVGSDGKGKGIVSDTENNGYSIARENDLSALYEVMLEYNESLLQNGQSLTDA